MASLAQLIAALPPRDEARLLARLVPPARFAAKRFAEYRPDAAHPSQAAARARLEALAAALRVPGPLARLRAWLGAEDEGAGIYLDGGFGVGKTHLLAAVWHAAPAPKAYLSFDELVYLVGLVGVPRLRSAFGRHRLIAVDEWELDDPGNLQLALAFLRGVLAAGARLVVTSNAVPDELGRGHFPQKDFRAEIEELAAAFEVVRISGEDWRHRRFEADPGREYLLSDAALARAAAAAGPAAVLTGQQALLRSLGQVHPIRYAELAAGAAGVFVSGLQPITRLPDALRWVHFVDKLYDAATPCAAAGSIALVELFPPDFLRGSYGRKFSRCLSRLEEMFGEARAGADLSREAAPATLQGNGVARGTAASGEQEG